MKEKRSDTVTSDATLSNSAPVIRCLKAVASLFVRYRKMILNLFLFLVVYSAARMAYPLIADNEFVRVDTVNVLIVALAIIIFTFTWLVGGVRKSISLNVDLVLISVLGLSFWTKANSEPAWFVSITIIFILALFKSASELIRELRGYLDSRPKTGVENEIAEIKQIINFLPCRFAAVIATFFLLEALL